ncbi:Tfp pilus assembly protein PilF [Thioflavicoccus mobilis 8321]|uniref:Tfp pilus assembly protein PilF n=2 Tax=Thioflavicoccus mobilis TaxID=80679 RepID=L0H2F8_9GAMM|nr:Tfp pilus assembly protein PilF [Thioflavicoccus mobilis 8321]
MPINRLRFFALLALSLLLAACDQGDRAQTYAERGQRLYDAGDFTRARLEFKNALQVDPRSSQAWQMLGQINEQEQNWKAALAAYGRAVELAPENYEARIGKGRLLVAANRLNDAEVEADAVLNAVPDDPGALALRGAIERRRGNLDAAIADAGRALRANPNYRAALELLARCRLDQGRLDDAKIVLERAIAAHPDDAAFRIGLAAVLERNGDVQGVIATLHDLIALQPAVQAHRLRLARIYAANAQLDAAEKTLRAVIDQSPGDLAPVVTLVRFLDETQDPEAGTAALESLSKAQPGNYPLRFALADRYRALGDSERAETIYRGIVSEQPEGENAARARGRLAALALTRGEAEQAEAIATETLEQDPMNSDALFVRAVLALRDNQPDQAIAALRTLLGQDPASIPALLLLAEANLAAGNVPLAVDALEKAIEAVPDAPEPYLQLVALKLRVGDVPGATRAAERLLAKKPDNKDAQTVLARLQLAGGDSSALAASAKRIMKQWPDDPLGPYLTGLALQREDRFEDSIVQLRSALEKNPNAVEPRLALARGYLALEQPERAEAELEQVLAAAPSSLSARLLLADVYRTQGRVEKAREQYEQAISTVPTAVLPYQRLLGLQLEQGDDAGARATVQAGLEATGGSPTLALALAIVHQQAAEYEAAFTAYERALAGNPKLDVAANSLAMLIADHFADDPDKMARALSLTSSLAASDNASYLDTAGWVAYRNGDYQQAARSLERSQELDDPTPERLYHLGMTYKALGRAGQAKALLTRAVEAGESFPGLDDARNALSTGP